MKFSRLKLTGFKSFTDPVELVFEPGLTGVVGPNGCGKSNLVEALRWVMGESSYKAMRASGMDDVIFSGSSNRPARNSAEVVVTLDNTDRTAPAQFNTADTLEISRRIEREQGSVYRVNGRDAGARRAVAVCRCLGAHSPPSCGRARSGTYRRQAHSAAPFWKKRRGFGAAFAAARGRIAPQGGRAEP